MVKRLTEINKTAVFAWSPGQETPYIASGTAAAALDDSFSNASELELFKLDLASSNGVTSVGKISSNSRFNKIVWGNVSSNEPLGVIAGGLENGCLTVWNPEYIIDGKSDQAVVVENTTHTGQIRGLDFNKFQKNLLASGGGNKEVFIWDLNKPNQPYSPGPKSQKLDDVTSVNWNGQVQHILATTSSTGNTVVWDLRNKKEVMSLSAPNTGGLNMGRRTISSAVWHPDVATQLVTASEDDSNPVVTLWDLRHAHSPEKILAGHSKGVLGLSWCRQDSDLLMSCGKDCKTLIWNPNSGELLGELAQDNNWTFQTEWCPRNPDLLASASFSGKINVYSLQNSEGNEIVPEIVEGVNDDPFSVAMSAASATLPSSGSSFALKNPPKWLRCPVGASFGFGGKLVTFNSKAAQAAAIQAANVPPGQALPTQSIPRSVSVSTVVTDRSFVQRSIDLETALEHQSVEQLVEDRVHQAKKEEDENEKESWEVIQTLLNPNAREELMNYLGFQKAQVVEAVAKITAGKKGLDSTTESNEEQVQEKELPAISDQTDSPESATVETEQIPSEDQTASGLFGDEPNDDFFAQSGSIQQNLVPEQDQGGISALNIIGSSIQHEPLELYSQGSSETDRLITRAIILGDFESAVDVCIAEGRFSDALLFAVCGGGDLLARTQQAYFKHQSKSNAYLRLLERIIDEDLASVVASVSLEEWTSVIVVLCTFAKVEDFKPLCEALGARLEEAWNNAETEGAKKFRRHATLCYLAAGNLEKVARIWIAEQEEEAEAVLDKEDKYATLQNLIEKVTIFRKVISFEDPALFETNEHKLSYEYPLSPLYDKYCEYADILAAQGKLTTALTYLSLTPLVYRKASFDKLSVIRDRVYHTCPVSISGQFSQPSTPFETKPIEVKRVEAEVQPVAQSTYGQTSQAPSYTAGYQPYQYTTSTATKIPGYTAAHSPVASNRYPTQATSYIPASDPYAPAATTSSYATTHSYGTTSVTPSYAPTAASATTSYAPVTASGPPTSLYQPQTSTSSHTATQPTSSYGYAPSSGNTTAPATGYNPSYGSTYRSDPYSNPPYGTATAQIPAPPPIAGIPPSSLSQANPPPKKAEGAWNDPPMAIAAAKKLKSPTLASTATKRVTSPFPNQPSASSFVNPQQYQQTSTLPPPPQGAFPPPPMNRGPPRHLVSPPPQQQAPQGYYAQHPQSTGPPPPPKEVHSRMVAPPPMGPPRGMTPPQRNTIPPPPMNAAPPAPLSNRANIPPPPQGGFYQQQRMN